MQTFVFKLWFEERFEMLRRFRDRLVWTVDLIVEIRLRFQISPAYIVCFLVRQQTSDVFDMTQGTLLKGRYAG